MADNGDGIPASDTTRILKRAEEIGFPIEWTAKNGASSMTGHANDREDLFVGIRSFLRDHKPAHVTLRAPSSLF